MDKSRIEILTTILRACKIISLTRLSFKNLSAGSAAVAVKEDLSSSTKKTLWSHENQKKSLL